MAQFILLIPLLSGLFVGLLLGLTGSGGSILAVPTFVYLLDIPVKQAVVLSLGIVSLSALYGAFMQRFSGHLMWHKGVTLGVSGLLGVPVGKALGTHIAENTTMLLFSSLMTFIGLRMVANEKSRDKSIGKKVKSCRYSDKRAEHQSDEVLKFNDQHPSDKLFLRLIKQLRTHRSLIGIGILTGALSGFFGVGGGFLIVPTLMAFEQCDIFRATATSLLAIIIISTFGFFSNIQVLEGISLIPPAIFLIGSLAGVYIGIRVKKFIQPRKLQIIVAIVILTVGALVMFNAITTATNNP